MVVILSGVDTFRSRDKLRQIIAQYQTKHPDGLGFTLLQGEELTVSDFAAALSGTSLFSEKRLVVIERPEAAPAEVQEHIGDAVGSLDPVVVLWCAEPLAEDSALAKLAAKRSVQHETFEPLRGSALSRWIAGYAAGIGASLERDAVAGLVAAAKNDTWRLANEIEKLAAHAGGGAITVGDVAALVDAPTSPRAFAFADALASRDRARALALLHEHLEAGDSPQALLGMIGYALRTLHLVRSATADAADRPKPVAALAKTLALHPFVVTQALRHAQGFASEDLRRATQLLADTDWYMKTGRFDPALALERFVVAVTAGR